MMDLPSYGGQLLQQLWALRREGCFCDCTILVGNSSHRAHKLVLAAASMLFRSLLDGSDTISIDTSVVSPSEFGCLLDMVYSGKLPMGKHNVGRMVAAADSLQMFDVAVGFKNALASLMVPQNPVRNKENQGNREDQEVQGIQEDEKDQENQGIQENQEVQEDQEKEENHQENKENQEVQEDPGNQEDMGNQGNQENKEKEENHQENKENQEDQENHQGIQENQGIQGNQKDQGNQEVQENQESQGIQEVQENQENQGNQEGEGTPMETDDTSGQFQLLYPPERRMRDRVPPPSPPSSPSRRFSCRWCQKGFGYRCRMLAHARRCPQSPARSALQRPLLEAAARPKKKVACDLCARTFAHPSGMIYHKRTEHFEEKPFGCQECGARFGAKSSLKNHQRLHTGEKPYACQHCHMSFSVAAALAYHTKKKHSEGKMYVCQYCKAAFAQSIELTRHVRTHTGDRPYVCRQCGKGYSQASGLTVHLHTFHNLSEPHDCQKCSLSFSSLEELQQHLRELHPRELTGAALLARQQHSGGGKPFSCQLCSKSYQQLSGLWYHNRTTHPDLFSGQKLRLFQCESCFRFFPSASSLTHHQGAEHRAPGGGEGGGRPGLLCFLFLPGGPPAAPALLPPTGPAGEGRGGRGLHLPHGKSPTGIPPIRGPGRKIGRSRSDIWVRSTADSRSSVVPAGSGEAEPEPAGGQQVNMYDLLSSSITFICQEKTPEPDS
ncbi:uncharacterized protein zbtb40 [Menidia menidia]